MPKPLTLLALGAFVAVDVLLVAFAWQSVYRDPPPSGLSDAAASPAPTPTEATGQVAFDFKPSAAGLMDVANDGTWVFAKRGICDGRTSGEVWTSADTGADPQERDPGLKSILGVSAESGGAITLVGADDACQVRQVRSEDGGATWVDELEVTEWSVSPTEPREVVSPDGRSSEPGCTVSSLSPVNDEFARVTCIDGIVKGTGNAGREWVDLGRLDNVRTASFTTFNTGYALARFEGCAAQIFTTRDSGRSWAPTSCIVGDPARAIAANDTTLVAVVGEERDVYTSEDGGRELDRP